MTARQWLTAVVAVAVVAGGAWLVYDTTDDGPTGTRPRPAIEDGRPGVVVPVTFPPDATAPAPPLEVTTEAWRRASRSGSSLICGTVTIVNRTSSEQRYAGGGWTLRHPSGEVTPAVDAADELALAPGASTTGTRCFPDLGDLGGYEAQWSSGQGPASTWSFLL